MVQNFFGPHSVLGAVLSFKLVLVHAAGAFGVRRGGGPERPDSGFWAIPSTPQWMTQLIQQAKEGRLPGVPAEEPVNQPPSGAKNLAGKLHPGVEERLELHPQQLVLLVSLDLCRAARGWPR